MKVSEYRMFVSILTDTTGIRSGRAVGRA